MNLPLTFFHLYCVNNKCFASIYNHSDPVEMPFTEENLVSEHYCLYCKQQMISAVDAEIEQLVATSDVLSHYNLNYN